MATSDTKMTTDMELAEEIERHGLQVFGAHALTKQEAEQIIAALRRGPEPSVPEGEQLWLIERTYAKGEPAERREFWLGGTTDMHNDSFYSGGDPVWTTDALKAARFPSRAIAETLRYRHFHPESTAEVCGHMFQCGSSPERPPSGEMVEVLRAMEEGYRLRCNYCGGDERVCDGVGTLPGACRAPIARKLLYAEASKEAK